MMYRIEAIVREEKLEDVKAALHAIEVNGLTIWQVLGFGSQHGYRTLVRGQEVDVITRAKVKLEIVVSSEEWCDKTVAAICQVARTGEVGDGKIFVSPVSEVIRIRTGERDYNALQPDEE